MCGGALVSWDPSANGQTLHSHPQSCTSQPPIAPPLHPRTDVHPQQASDTKCRTPGVLHGAQPTSLWATITIAMTASAVSFGCLFPSAAWGYRPVPLHCCAQGPAHATHCLKSIACMKLPLPPPCIPYKPEAIEKAFLVEPARSLDATSRARVAACPVGVRANSAHRCRRAFCSPHQGRAPRRRVTHQPVLHPLELLHPMQSPHPLQSPQLLTSRRA